MKLFIIPSWYPSSSHPSTGIFFKEQAQILARKKPDWSIGLSLWGSHNPKLWIQPKKPLDAIIKLSSKLPARTSQQLLSGNCIEFFTPAFTWNRHIKRGNFNGILEAQENNFRLFTEYFGKPDVIHAQVSFPAGYYAMQLSQRYQIPYVITEHMSPFPMPSLQSAMNKYILPSLKNAGLVLTVSKGLQDQMSEYGVKSELTNNFIDQKTFCFDPITDGTFTFLAMGRLEKQKGYDLLLNSAKYLVNKGVDFRLKIGGTGGLERLLKSRSKQLGLNGHIIWLGELTREEVKRELVECHCLVSTSHHENQPVAIMEALAVGRPVLTTAWKGSAELILDEDLGQVADTRNPEEFGEAMIKMIKKTYDHQKIASLFDKHFGAENTVDRLEEKLQRTLTK